MERVRVTILVDGGVVQSIDCGDFVDVEVVDFDNLRAEGKSEEERDQIWQAACERAT
jgi:hypothetical protein